MVGMGIPCSAWPLWGQSCPGEAVGQRQGWVPGDRWPQPRFWLTLILGTEDEDPVAGDHLELVVLAGTNHLDDGQRDHTLGVGLLKAAPGGVTPLCPGTPAPASLGTPVPNPGNGQERAGCEPPAIAAALGPRMGPLPSVPQTQGQAGPLGMGTQQLDPGDAGAVPTPCRRWTRGSGS